MEMAGAHQARPFVEMANSTHPSLIDVSHQMDLLFGVLNIPSVIWIDEEGIIVRPAEPRRPMPLSEESKQMTVSMGNAESRREDVARLRDWVANGAYSRYALTPEAVVARSTPRSRAVSEAAGHFELAQHLWQAEGFSERCVAHFNAAHELQPENIGYKRQAYSALGFERYGSRSQQWAADGDDWPFISDFNRDCDKYHKFVADPD